ncbi:MAG: chromosomal replication initiator protein DnaA [Alphaproteobacteria bacterium]|nr:chromosomal replication initiator protein DnaA [Alphaproteobacteria bacterium]
MSNLVKERIDNNISDENQQDIWPLVKESLRLEFGEDTFKSWISKLECKSSTSNSVSFIVPTRFIRDWVVTHFEKKIIKSWQKHNSSVKKINITIAKASKSLSINEEKPSSKVKVIENDHSDSLKSFLDSRFVFDTFIAGPSNEFAYAAARAVSESKKVQPGSNPLFLYGGVGLGKTHLMHAIAWHINKTNPSRKVVYISAEKFMYQFIKALRTNEIMQFKETYRSADVLMVDDIQFICGKDSTQEEFFHTLNTLIDNNRQVVISGDRSPSDLQNMEERIKSRLGWGLVADIHNTTYELRLGILQSKIEKIGIVVPNEVLEFLASKITSNVRELEGALNKVIAHTNLTKQEVTLGSTQDILRDLLRANERNVTIEEVQKKVAERHNLKVSDMYSSKRARNIARPRQIAMYLSKSLTSHSLAEIGKKFGGKDHTTVMHAIKKVEDLLKADKEFSEDVRLLMKVLQC